MFFDAESGEGTGGAGEGEAAGGGGASDTSSEAGSLTSEEGSVSSENSELGGSEYNHPTQTCKSSITCVKCIKPWVGNLGKESTAAFSDTSIDRSNFLSLLSNSLTLLQIFL